jgi:hypothetical protein
MGRVYAMVIIQTMSTVTSRHYGYLYLHITMDTINADLWAQYGLTAMHYFLMLMATRNIEFTSPLHPGALVLPLCVQHY